MFGIFNPLSLFLQHTTRTSRSGNLQVLQARKFVEYPLGQLPGVVFPQIVPQVACGLVVGVWLAGKHHAQEARTVEEEARGYAS